MNPLFASNIGRSLETRVREATEVLSLLRIPNRTAQGGFCSEKLATISQERPWARAQLEERRRRGVGLASPAKFLLSSPASIRSIPLRDRVRSYWPIWADVLCDRRSPYPSEPSFT